MSKQDVQQDIKNKWIRDTFHAIVAEGALANITFDNKSGVYAFKNRKIYVSIEAIENHVGGRTYNIYSNDAPFKITINKNIGYEFIKTTLLHELAHILDSERLQNTALDHQNWTSVNSVSSLYTRFFIGRSIAEWIADKHAIFSDAMTMEDLLQVRNELTAMVLKQKERGRMIDATVTYFEDHESLSKQQIAQYGAWDLLINLALYIQSDATTAFIHPSAITQLGWIEQAIEHKVNSPNTSYSLFDQRGNVDLSNELESLEHFICKEFTALKYTDISYIRALFCKNYAIALQWYQYNKLV